MAGTDLEMWLSDSMSAEFIVDYLCKSAIRPLSNGVRFFFGGKTTVVLS